MFGGLSAWSDSHAACAGVPLEANFVASGVINPVSTKRSCASNTMCTVPAWLQHQPDISTKGRDLKNSPKRSATVPADRDLEHQKYSVALAVSQADSSLIVGL